MKGIVIAFLLCIAGVISASAQLPYHQENPPNTINGGIVNGKAISLPKPMYPDEARLANIGGPVMVDVIIDEGGNVISAKRVARMKKDAASEEITEKTRLLSLLDDAVENAAMQATFAPTLLNGNPVKVTGRLVYNFRPTGEAVRTLSGGVLNNKATKLPQPAYPPAAVAVRAQGVVSVQVTIDENGDVISASAASGHPLLQGAAVSAAQAAKFAPTLLSGEPVRVSGVITYKFELPKPENK